jgi:hypothetical protein
MAKPSLTPDGKIARYEWLNLRIRLASLVWRIVDARESQALALITPQLTERQRARFEARVLLLEAERDLLKARLEQLRAIQKVHFSA